MKNELKLWLELQTQNAYLLDPTMTMSSWFNFAHTDGKWNSIEGFDGISFHHDSLPKVEYFANLMPPGWSYPIWYSREHPQNCISNLGASPLMKKINEEAKTNAGMPTVNQLRTASIAKVMVTATIRRI